MSNKKFRIFCGPNGSGKSTLISQINKNFNIGYFVNADEIEKLFNLQHYFDCSTISYRNLSQSEWVDFLKKLPDSRINNLSFEGIEIKENFFISTRKINSYHASIIAEFFRNILLEGKHTFSFETVMSHDSKVAFIREAKERGFTTYLYFICTQDPELNIQRVKSRVEKGEHNVDPEKIKSRYFKSLGLLYEAFKSAERAYIIDNSSSNRKIILEKKNNAVEIFTDLVPEWVNDFILKKLE